MDQGQTTQAYQFREEGVAAATHGENGEEDNPDRRRKDGGGTLVAELGETVNGQHKGDRTCETTESKRGLPSTTASRSIPIPRHKFEGVFKKRGNVRGSSGLNGMGYCVETERQREWDIVLRRTDKGNGILC